MKNLVESILAGKSAEAEQAAQLLLDSGTSVHDIMASGIEEAMDSLRNCLKIPTRLSAV